MLIRKNLIQNTHCSINPYTPYAIIEKLRLVQERELPQPSAGACDANLPHTHTGLTSDTIAASTRKPRPCMRDALQGMVSSF
jgi:hypothetical protein